VDDATRPTDGDPQKATPEQAAEGVDAARAALARVRQAAEARGEVKVRATGPLVAVPGQPAQRRRRPRTPEGYSGRDPLGLGSVVNRMVAERGWRSPVAVGSVMSRWGELVGPEVAAHCSPESFEGSVLHVRCDSTAWATQLRLLSTALLDRFRRELGDGVVTRLHILGPAAPSWRKGPRHVRGRGPRDTYG
jgi:predicted nucleic acid-binding Zn ribbon protein